MFPISMCFSKCLFAEENMDSGILWKVFPIACFLFAGGVGTFQGAGAGQERLGNRRQYEPPGL